MKLLFFILLIGLTGQSSAGLTLVFVVNSTADASDAVIDGVCDIAPVRGAAGECTLRAAIEEANQFSGKTIINFNINDAGCVNDVCTIVIDQPNLGALPDIVQKVEIDGSTQPNNTMVCSQPPATRPDYKVVLQGQGIDIGLRLEMGSDGSLIRGLNIRNFFNNIAIINGVANHIECNFIGSDETGLVSTGNNPANGIIFGCESRDNIIGGSTPELGNVIGGHDGDGIQFYAGFVCTPPGSLPSNNSISGNFIGVGKDGVTPLSNQYSGISFFGGAAFSNYIGTLQDGTTLSGNIIGNSESGVYISDASHNIVIKGNSIGTDPTGTVNHGNLYGGIDIISGNNNVVGGTEPGADNLIAYNSEGVFITGVNSSGNSVRGNRFENNLTQPIDIVLDGGITPDGINPNDANDADTGANLLMNHPDVIDAEFFDLSGDKVAIISFLVDTTSTNASYPLVVDVYYDEDGRTGGQGAMHVGALSYETPQDNSPELVDLPDHVEGGLLRLTATDSDGNTSEMSAAVQIGFIDLIFANGFD